MNKSFSQRLTPGQVQKVLDNILAEWREYRPNPDGWIDMYHEHLNSDLGVNVLHGGWVDHYQSGEPEGKGDIVSLVAMHTQGIWYKPDIHPEDHKKAIAWIQDQLGMQRGVQPPDMPEGADFAGEWLKKENENYVQMPNDIWQSDLTASAKVVWMAIYSRINKGQIYSFAGIRDICKQTRLANATVQRAIKELESSGVLIQKPSGVGQKVNKYPIVMKAKKINRNRKINLSAEKVADALQKWITVSEIDTDCIRNWYGGVSETGTELDPLNKNKELKPKAQGLNGKTPFMPAGYFSLFLLTFQESKRRYETCMEKGITALDLIEQEAAA